MIAYLEKLLYRKTIFAFFLFDYSFLKHRTKWQKSERQRLKQFRIGSLFKQLILKLERIDLNRILERSFSELMRRHRHHLLEPNSVAAASIVVADIGIVVVFHRPWISLKRVKEFFINKSGERQSGTEIFRFSIELKKKN